jgi:hypothetical protein
MSQAFTPRMVARLQVIGSMGLHRLDSDEDFSPRALRINAPVDLGGNAMGLRQQIADFGNTPDVI